MSITKKDLKEVLNKLEKRLDKKFITQDLKLEKAIQDQTVKFDQALQTQDSKLEKAIQDQTVKFDQALQTQDLKLEKAIQDQTVKFDQALQTQDLKLEKAIQDQTVKFEKAHHAQDDRFGAMLLKHFYTKDECDQKFATKVDLCALKKDVKKAIDEGVDRLRVLIEAGESKTQLISEGYVHLTSKVNNHEKRIE